MSKTIKMRVTVTYEYDAYIPNYPDSEPEAMARVDRTNFETNTSILLDDISGRPCEITVTPVTD
ncbi:hypothetical protein [Dyella silvatica]|uniref:hypothetical protein n=1 Tax=Dyella silvatica TaxID=2992128 RepID=UPI0022577C77|nr:hypothetical protein [Dyella silvatica]